MMTTIAMGAAIGMFFGILIHGNTQLQRIARALENRNKGEENHD